MTTTAFAAACLLDPWDDTPRLVMADWMEESGDVDRASLIRLQVELARRVITGRDRDKFVALRGRYQTRAPVPLKANTTPVLMLREWIALSRHTGDKATGERWDRLLCGKCKGKQYIEGRPTRDHPSGILECPVCGGSGDLAYRTLAMDETHLTHNRPRPLHWDRGFLHLGCTLAEAVEERECDSKDCRNGWQLDGAGGIATDDLTWERIRHARCSGSGRIPTLTAWGRAVVDSGCGLWLEGVEPTDCGEGLWVWNFGTEPGTLPRWLMPFFSTNRHSSPDAAKLELSRAVTAFAARQVWKEQHD